MVLSVNNVSCRISPTKEIEEEVKFQPYILNFLLFLHWKAIHENTYKGILKKIRESLELFLEFQSPVSVFSGEKIVFEFFGRRVLSCL